MNSTKVDIKRANNLISFANIQSVHNGNRSVQERDPAGCSLKSYAYFQWKFSLTNSITFYLTMVLR